jgi:heme/copper-type cytochrome/quinol oxidase subunit 3
MSQDLGGYPVDRPDLTPRSLTLGSWVLTAATIVFFSAFVFAYVYLKTLNTHGLWNPGHEVSVAFGSVVAAVAVVSAVAYGIGVRRARDDDTTRWQGWATISFLAGLSTIGLHVWRLQTLPFVPTNGSYGSVFVAWTVALIVVELGAMYWLLTLVRGATWVAGAFDPYDRGSQAQVAHVAASARGYWLFWRMIVIVEILAFVLLVLVR